jgi:predicted Zn-dependent protease
MLTIAGSIAHSPDKLLPKLEMRLAKNPKDIGLIGEIVELLDKNAPKAIEYRQRLLSLSPEDNRVKLELAQMQEAKGNRKEAVQLYLAVAGDFAGDKAFNLKLADLLLQERRPADAARHMEIALSLDPNDKALTLKLAALFGEGRQSDKALDMYLKAMEAVP